MVVLLRQVMLLITLVFLPLLQSFATDPPRSPYKALLLLVPDEKSELFYLTVRSRVGLVESFPLIERDSFTPRILEDGAEHSLSGSLTPKHFQGRLGKSQRVTPNGVAASIYDGKLYVRFIGKRANAYVVQVALPRSWQEGFELVANVKRARRLKSYGCDEPITLNIGSGYQSFVADEPVADTPRSLSRRQTLEISTDADAEYFAEFGRNSNARIQSILNAVEAVYLRELNINVQLIRQNVFRDGGGQPYSSRRSETLLGQFQSYTQNNNHLGSFDVAHLFTGKTLFQDVLGIAFLGSVCVQPSLSYSLSQEVNNSIDWIVTGHEIAHNLGAVHDSSSPNIMFPRVSAEHTSFSHFSIGQITDFVEATNERAGGSCLALRAPRFPIVDTFTVELERPGTGTYHLRSNIEGLVPETCRFGLFASKRKRALKKNKRYSRNKKVRRVGVWNISSINQSVTIDFGELSRQAVRRRSRVFLRGEVTCSSSRYRTNRISIRTNGAFKKATRNIRNTLSVSVN